MLTACGGDAAATETSDPVTGDEASVELDDSSSSEVNRLYAWVDRLNIRTRPELGSEVVTQIATGTELIPTGNRTETTETVTLRGTAYTEPWIEVTTPEGKTGWVFGGAVRTDAAAAREQDAATQPFWEEGLRGWDTRFRRSGGLGDAETTETVYARLDRILQVEVTDVGDYGFSTLHRLFTDDYRLLRERRLVLQAETDSGQPLLTETVYDFTTPTPRVGRRSQTRSGPFYGKNRPTAVRGEVRYENLTEEQAETVRAAALIIEPFGLDAWPAAVRSGDGCSCSYSGGNRAGGASVFATNYTDGNQHGVIKLNGRMIALKNKDAELRRLAGRPDWIVLREGAAPTLFGERIDIRDEAWYYAVRDQLVAVLLALEELPASIPIKTEGTVGMGTRGEFRSMVEEALAEAKRLRNDDRTQKLLFSNERYAVRFDGYAEGKNDGGNVIYEGSVSVYDREGNLLAGTTATGGCGC